MSLLPQLFERWMAAAIIVGFLVIAVPVAHAQTVVQGAPESVQTYVDQAVPPTSGDSSWNRTYKAGELQLLRSKKSSAKAPVPPIRPSLPVGQLKAPQLQMPQLQAPAQPPKLAAPQSSAASVMLLQGMKNALQQSGQNPNLPKSDIIPATGAPVSDQALKPPAVTDDTGIVYEKGRGPQDLSTSKPLDAESQAEAKTDTELSPDSAPAPAAASAEIPKATELMQEPAPLANSASENSGDSGDSIFGAPVGDMPSSETAEKKTDDSLAIPPSETHADFSSCSPNVVSWTKECSDAGYPSTFSGKITGETRTECPNGDAHDVWLSNTCAPPASVEASADPRATDMSVEPKPLEASDSTPGAAEKSDPTISTSIPVRTDASCGAANGLATGVKPVSELCTEGSATEVAGQGPWRWSCKGIAGGMTVSCAAPISKTSAPAVTAKVNTSAPISAEDAKCGSADGVGTDTAPTQNLCTQGNASRVNGGGPWTWACSGSNGGKAAACSAPKKVDGTCGAAHQSGTDTMPQRDLCAAGYASAVTGDGPWSWTCSGLYGGAAATCEATPKLNAVCGPASLTGHKETPKDGLCTSGEASSVDGIGPWTWSCAGNNGGASVSCRAPTVTDGTCGSASGSSFEKSPKEDLCEQGTASRVTNDGSWEWTCAGADGGATASCTAVIGSKPKLAPSEGLVACGSAAETAAFQAPVDNLCVTGKASAVAGSGPWTWSCSDEEGHTAACSTLNAVEGACGTAANVPSPDAPTANLCAAGSSGKVVAAKGKTHWSWECEGSLGAATVSCSAPVAQVDASKAVEGASCGLSAGRGVTTIPSSELCDQGKASAVHGKGPWSWTCTAKGGAKVSCEAPKMVDGTCGSANGSILNGAPEGGLCIAGNPTTISGTGPWLWSCVGIAGGSSASCSANAQSLTKIDGTCGAASNAVMTSLPEANLCDTGLASKVYGDGPWTWTCSGQNGGIASTCTTSKVMPKGPAAPGPAINANCGPANGVAMMTQPVDGLCSSGTVTDISGDGPWNWNCLGSNGGMTVSCTAPLMPPAPIIGVCGAAHGVSTLAMPKSALCSAGIASTVSGKGPWTWSCSGTNGGGAVSCVAPLAGSSNPLPSVSTPGDEAPAPKAAPVGLVTPRLPAGPLPALESGTLPKLKPSKPVKIDAVPESVSPPEPPKLPEAPAGSEGIKLPKNTLPRTSEGMPPSPSRDGTLPTPGTATMADNGDAPSKVVLDSDISTITFDRNSDVLDDDAIDALDELVKVLKQHRGAHITLTAYADNHNITPREARRLSLARALTARDYLTRKGIASDRIDVRALGANVSSGDPDRIDVKVN